MPNIDSVQFDHTGWQPIEKKPYINVWGDDVKLLTAVLTLEYFDAPPEIPVSLHDINAVRFVYRNIAMQSGAGLMQADVVAVGNVDCIQTIFKLPQPPRGMVYVGSLTIPFKDFSYVIKIQGVEQGLTGVREAMILDRKLNEGVKLDPVSNKLIGWEQDPYEPGEEFPLMPNLAESEEYDEMFPKHALSRVRKTLEHIKDTLKLDDEVKASEPFPVDPQ